jgi:hypothetical protein
MRGRLQALLLALCLGWPGTGLAGWRYAEWGMTKAEVIAASKNAAKPYVVAVRRSWGEYPALVAPYADMTHTYEAWFYFDKHEERLYAIRLVPTGRFWCIDIRREIMERYGSNHRMVENEAIWQDPAHNNRISITSFQGCTIRYEPLATPG